MRENALTEGRIGPVLLKFAIPFFFASLLQALYGAVDLLMVGQFTGTAAQAAVSTGTQVMQIVTGITMGICTGVTVTLGNRVGAKDDEGAALSIGSGTITLIVLAAIVTPLLLVFTDGIITVMQIAPEAVGHAQEYMITCALGTPFIMGYLAVSAIYRGLGDSKTPLVFIAIACFINIVADLLLVGFAQMGALGAALATVLAQGISFLLSLLHIRRRGFPFPLARHHFRPKREYVGKIVQVGAPLALQESLVNLSFLIITAIVNSIHITASASVGIVEKIIYFAMLIPLAFSSAVATMAAQNLGAGKPERAFQTVKSGILYSLIVGIIVCLACQIFPESITILFSKDDAVISMAATYLRTYALDCIMVAFVFPLNSYFSGLGRSMIVMAHSLLTTFLVRIPISYFASKTVTTSLIFMGFAPPGASLASIIILLVYFLYLRKRVPSLFHSQEKLRS